MRKFTNEVLWRVTVDVNGKQEYNINETNYDHINNLIHLNLISCISLSQLFMNFCKINNLYNLKVQKYRIDFLLIVLSYNF